MGTKGISARREHTRGRGGILLHEENLTLITFIRICCARQTASKEAFTMKRTMKTMMLSSRYNASAIRSTFDRRIMRTHVAAANAMPSKHQQQLSRQQSRDAIFHTTLPTP